MGFMKAEIGLGVVGLGMGQSVFVTHELPGSTMRVKALCDTNAKRLAEAAAKHPVPCATADYAEVLRRADVDVVCLYTPDALHFGQIMAALETGKHVLCTKPMVTSLADGRAVLAAVRRSGRKFLVGQTCRFIPSFLAARQLVQEDRYGRLLYVEATYNHDMRPVLDRTPWRWQMPQDLLFGGLCHPMDLALWVGGRVSEVSAFAAHSGLDERYPKDLPDNFIVNLRFASGALGRVIGLYGFTHGEGMPYIELTVSGTQAASHQDKITWEPHAGERRVEDLAAHLPRAHEGTDYQGHSGEVARYLHHFEACLREDREPEPGALEGVRVLAALDAVRESARTGRTVPVEWET